MILFRWLALILIAGSMLYFMVLTRRSALKRLFVVSFFGAGAAFVVRPDLTSRIAAVFGIGRGADLVFYLSILFLFFLCFNLYLHFSRLASRQSELVRELALRQPVQVPDAHGARDGETTPMTRQDDDGS